MTVFMHGAAATPTRRLEALAARTDLEAVRVVHLHLEGAAPHVGFGRQSAFRAVSLFASAPLRQAVAEGRADFVPVFLSDVPHRQSMKPPRVRGKVAPLRDAGCASRHSPVRVGA
jgi:acyl-CoA hydrolase